MFTREAGMLFADAKSVREERSKQRYALQDFSLVRVTLVKGKSGWKIGSIEALRNYYTEACDKAARGSVVSTIKFLRRFFSGEDPAEELFDTITSFLDELVLPVRNRLVLEKVLQVKVLAALGYVAPATIPVPVLGHSTPKEYQSLEITLEPILDRLITTAISTSHL